MNLRITVALLSAACLAVAACSSGSSSSAPDAGNGNDAGDAAMEQDSAADTGPGADSGDSSVAMDSGGGEASGGDSGPISDAGGQALLSALVVSSGTLRPAFDSLVTDYDITSLNSLYSVSVTATTATIGATMKIHGVAATSGVAASVTLMSREDLTVVVSASGQSTTYTIHYVPSDFPAYTVSAEAGAGTEDVLMTANGEYALMIDRAGNPLYYRTFLPNGVENLQQSVLPDGGTYYSVAVGVTNPGGWTLGVDHVMDQQFNDVADFQLPAYAQHGVLPAEAHDFQLLGPQHYVAQSYVQRTLDLSTVNPAYNTAAQVMSCILQEVDNGNVLVEWDSANYTSLYGDSISASMLSGTALVDYLHMNSLQVDPSDGNFIVSFRNTSSVIKINRTTAAIMWTLGGKEDQFGLTGAQVFSLQHHARKQADGSLTIFDDDNGTNPSSALSFKLDEVNHTVTSFTVLYARPTGGPASGFMGSATPLSGGRTFVGWGGWFTPGLAADATEVVNGVPVWSLQFSVQGVFTYRALPIASP